MADGKRLFQEIAGSPIRADLVTLFRRNPGLVDSLDGIARRIGRRGVEVEADVQTLVGTGMIVRRSIGPRDVFAFNRKRDEEISSRIAEFVKGLKGKEDGR